jgi:hypothetical protein
MKYTIYASETVYYMKEVEAESEEQARELVFQGEIDFYYGDITDGANFNIDEIIKEG